MWSEPDEAWMKEYYDYINSTRKAYIRLHGVIHTAEMLQQKFELDTCPEVMAVSTVPEKPGQPSETVHVCEVDARYAHALNSKMSTAHSPRVVTKVLIDGKKHLADSYEFPESERG